MRHLVIILCLLSSPALSQSMMVGVDRADAQSYTGPGNVVSGAQVWWGLRAYNAAWATGHNKIANICTPSDAVCADVNSDSSGNFNLAGTGSLTCNNGGSICTVKILYDQSGVNNCGGSPCDVTNATIANRPILVVPGAANGCSTTSNFCMSINSAGGGPQSLCASADFTTGSVQPFTISFVFNNPVRTGDEWIFGSSNFNFPGVVSGSGGANKIGISMNAGVGSAAATDGSYYATQGVYNNTASDVNINGTPNTVSIASTTAYTTIRACLFNFTGPTGGANNFGGFATELGIWPTAVTWTTTTSTLMSANQRAYWGF